MRSTVKHTAVFQIRQPIEAVFPLFSAEGEKLWVPGWNYENIMGSTELHEDYVFVTKNHDHAAADAIWLTKRHQPESYLVQFYKVEPKNKVGIVTIQCRQLEDSLTQVDVTYKYIALSKHGDDFIKQFTSSQYQMFIKEWERLLVEYFKMQSCKNTS